MASTAGKIGNIALSVANGVQQILISKLVSVGAVSSGTAGIAGIVAAMMKLIVDLVAAYQQGMVNVFNDYETPLLPYKSPEEEQNTEALRTFIRNYSTGSMSTKTASSGKVQAATNAHDTTLNSFLAKNAKWLVLSVLVALSIYVIVYRKKLFKWQ